MSKGEKHWGRSPLGAQGMGAPGRREGELSSGAGPAEVGAYTSVERMSVSSKRLVYCVLFGLILS